MPSSSLVEMKVEVGAGMYILQVGLFFSPTESDQGPFLSPFTSCCLLCAHSDTFYGLKLAHSALKAQTKPLSPKSMPKKV